MGENVGRCMKRIYKTCIAFILAVALIIIYMPAEESYASGSVTMSAGYCGGPYYERTVLSSGDLQSGTYTYTVINSGGSVSVVTATGRKLSSIISATGISSGSISQLRFKTSDSGSGYYNSYSVSTLLSNRYYYPNLPDNYADGALIDSAAAKKGALPVDTILAATTEGMTNRPYRLMVGQTQPLEQTANMCAYGVVAIDMELTGEPVLSLSQLDSTLEVGKTYTLTLTVGAYDSALEEDIKADVTWSSDNESVATVDSSGNVEIVGAGSATITASYAMKNKTVTATASIVKAAEGGCGSS